MSSSNADSKNLHAGHRKRVKNSVVEHGFSHLEDYRLLELILYYSIPRNDTNELAHRLIGEFGSLNGVFSADIKQLQHVQGVGENTAILLSAIGEAHKKADTSSVKRRFYKSKDAICELAVSFLKNENKEKAMLFCFSGDYRLKKHIVLCEGDEFSANFETRKIVACIMESDSSFAVIAHNHPVGEASPSGSDIDATRAVCVMLRNLGYALVDHVIVGKDSAVYSMRSDPRFKQLFM